MLQVLHTVPRSLLVLVYLLLLTMRHALLNEARAAMTDRNSPSPESGPVRWLQLPTVQRPAGRMLRKITAALRRHFYAAAPCGNTGLVLPLRTLLLPTHLARHLRDAGNHT